MTTYDGHQTEYVYDTDHALTEIAFPDATHVYYSYDDTRRLSATYRDNGSNRIDITYGEAGLISLADSLGGQTDLYFNHLGTIEKVVNPLGHAVEMDYDQWGNMTRFSTPLGATTTYVYDELDNIVRSTNTLGNTTYFSYTRAFNQLDELIDANGSIIDYNYDTNGNLVSITYADGSYEHWEYDALGSIDEWQNRRGQSVTFTVDNDGRVTSRTYEDGSVVTFGYDDRGNLVQAVDLHGTTTFSYDANDYLKRIDYPDNRSLAYGYDSSGRRTSMTDQLGNATNYFYDALGRLSHLTDRNDDEIVQYSYDTLGRLARTDKGNGTYSRYEYDAASQLLHLINYLEDGSVNTRFDYTYDADGRPTGMSTIDGDWSYDYDATGQLTHAVFTSTNPAIESQDIAYEYDALGNRIRTLINGVETIYAFNSLNQYTGTRDTANVYDADGNLIQDTSPQGTKTYGYSQDNKLLTVTCSNGDSWEYVYDAFGNRVAVTHNGQTTEYVIDPTGLGDVVGEYEDSTGNLLTSYVHGRGLISQFNKQLNSRSYYESDALGSTVAISDALGSVVNSYSYLPFGGELEWTETLANDFQFVGQWGVMSEGNGLEYMRARFYDPNAGRFVAADPIGLLGGDENFYAYIANAPLSSVDPGGTSPRFWDRAGKVLDAIDEVEFGKGGNLYRDHIMPRKQLDAQKRVWEEALKQKRIRDWDEYVEWWRGLPEDERRDIGYPFNRPSEAERYWWDRFADAQRKEALKKLEDSRSNGGGDGGGDGPMCVPPIWPDDPNDKLGPVGYGDQGFIIGDSTVGLPHTIMFENLADASAPAHWIRVEDVLDEAFDINAFELTGLVLGHEVFEIPPGLDAYQAMFERTIEGHELLIDANISLDRSTRKLSASLMALDPETGWLHENPLIGLLYPNDLAGAWGRLCLVHCEHDARTCRPAL